MSRMMEDPAAEANRRYWETDESVADIARDLEFSRRALYSAVIPLPAGRDCDDCGAELTYENRSARNADDAICTVCATGEPPPDARPGADGDETADLALLAGAGLAGATVGALVTLLLVPRR